MIQPVTRSNQSQPLKALTSPHPCANVQGNPDVASLRYRYGMTHPARPVKGRPRNPLAATLASGTAKAWMAATGQGQLREAFARDGALKFAPSMFQQHSTTSWTHDDPCQQGTCNLTGVACGRRLDKVSLPFVLKQNSTCQGTVSC